MKTKPADAVDDEPRDPEAIREDVRELPPSSKLAFYALTSMEDGPITQMDLASETQLPPRTTRFALDRLEDIDAVTKRTLLSDARQSAYEAVIEYPGDPDG